MSHTFRLILSPKSHSDLSCMHFVSLTLHSRNFQVLSKTLRHAGAHTPFVTRKYRDTQYRWLSFGGQISPRGCKRFPTVQKVCTLWDFQRFLSWKLCTCYFPIKNECPGTLITLMPFVTWKCRARSIKERKWGQYTWLLLWDKISPKGCQLFFKSVEWTVGGQGEPQRAWIMARKQLSLS